MLGDSKPTDDEPIRLSVDKIKRLKGYRKNEENTPTKIRSRRDREIVVNLLNAGASVSLCAKALGVTERTIYNYKNEIGDLDNPNYEPKASPGPKPKLSPEEIEEIRSVIKAEELTAAAAVIYIEEEYGISYCENQIRRIFGNEIKVLRVRKK